MLRARQECPLTPTMPDEKVRQLRARLILEEALETIKALGVKVFTASSLGNVDKAHVRFESSHEAPDLVEIADGCADISVVTIGTLIACGIQDVSLLEAVDQNNLEKFKPGHSINEHGKLIKPPKHLPPDIDKVLREQGWRSPTWEDAQMPKLP